MARRARWAEDDVIDLEPTAPPARQRTKELTDMSPIAVYAIARARGRLDPRPAPRRSRHDRGVSSQPGNGLGPRFRRLFGGGPRIVREPGFAGYSDGTFFVIVPHLVGYPYR
jgi:hypothetical protein